MVDPISVTIGIGVAVVIGLAIYGVYLAGGKAARSDESLVDMAEVGNYYRHVSANRALSQDVEAGDVDDNQ